MAASFDRVARIYRWGEYLSFGPLLAMTRRAHVERLGGARHAVVFGDGDGRFTELALRRHPGLCVTAVDVSPAMLGMLKRRCARYADRLTTIKADATDACLPLDGFDAAVAHFFLDCLSGEQVARLVGRVPDASVWVVSDFAVPGGVLRLPAKVLVRCLYVAFRVLAGLRTQRLPRWQEALAAHGFRRVKTWRQLGGILISEVWERLGETEGGQSASKV